MPGDRAIARPSGAAPVLLVTGANGQIGFELVRELAPFGTVVAPSRSELDLERPETIRALVQRVRPSVIVNAAAYTAVDKAESDRQRCFAVNAEAPGVFAEEAARVGAALIHYSTDYVFDGTKTSPYVETDAAAPLNVYGESKLAGERAIESVGGAWMVLRTSWVYGMRGNNFLRTILRLAREQRELRVVDDQMGAPTWSTSVAKATAHVVSTANAGTPLRKRQRCSARRRRLSPEFSRAHILVWVCPSDRRASDRVRDARSYPTHPRSHRNSANTGGATALVCSQR